MSVPNFGAQMVEFQRNNSGEVIGQVSAHAPEGSGRTELEYLIVRSTFAAVEGEGWVTVSTPGRRHRLTPAEAHKLGQALIEHAREAEYVD